MIMSTSTAAIFPIDDTGDPAVEIPDRIAMALVEFERLALAVTGRMASGDLFPGLSYLTSLTPVIGVLRDFCVSRVVHQDDDGVSESSRGMSDRKPEPLHPGIYL